jgi:hypothetical protein
LPGNFPDRRAEALPQEEADPRAPGILQLMKERLERRSLLETKQGDQVITGAVRRNAFACFPVEGIARVQYTQGVAAGTAEKPVPVRQRCGTMAADGGKQKFIEGSESL